MSQSSKRDEQIAFQESESKRTKKKNSSPPDNYGDRYVTGLEKLRTQGKGDKNRIVSTDWYSDEITTRLERIYGTKKAK